MALITKDMLKTESTKAKVLSITRSFSTLDSSKTENMRDKGLLFGKMAENMKVE